MRIRTFFLIVVLAIIVIFTALNWSAIMAPTTLSLGVATVQAPLGLVMLGLMVFLAAVFLVFILYLQTSVLLDARRHARELQTHRELVDQAEASRFTELRRFLEEELQKVSARETEARAEVLQRIEALERNVRGVVEQSGNSLSAYIGELDERLHRSGKGPPH